MMECRKPIPVKTPLGEGYVWYVTSNGILENDEYTVILKQDGTIRHFKTDQIHVIMNSTYCINDGSNIQPFEL